MASSAKLVSIGNYRLDSITLGEGSFAKVKKASHVSFGEPIALKIISLKDIDKNIKKHVYREAKIMGRLNHPNVVQLIEVCKTEDLFCLALEYLDGKNLYDHLKSRVVLAESDARKICQQLISAISYVHKMQIIHRDLKLENILMERSGRVVLIDFGLSNFWNPGKHLNTRCGSTEYAAPELFVSNVPYGSGVDIWSFGVILYALVIGHLPFQDEDGGRRDNLIIQIRKGLVPCHFREMKGLSFDCRVLILRCLDINHRTRINMEALLLDSWLDKSNDHFAQLMERKANVKDEDIAQLMKQKFQLNHRSLQDILDYVRVKKYGSTAGCFNIIKLQSLRSEENDPPTSNLTAERKKDSLKDESARNDDQKELKEPAITKQSNNGSSPSWRRSFLSVLNGKLSMSRLKRVDNKDSAKIDEKENSQGKMRQPGMPKALKNISNTIGTDKERPQIIQKSAAEIKKPKVKEPIVMTGNENITRKLRNRVVFKSDNC